METRDLGNLCAEQGAGMISPRWLVQKKATVQMRMFIFERFRDSRMAVIWPILLLALLAACAPTPETARTGASPGDPTSGSERPRESRAATNRLGPAHDLSADEAQGGHTLSRHVGRSDSDLRERLEHERSISAASTYTDRARAEAVVGNVLEHNSRVEQWEERGGRRPNLALDYHGDRSQPIGRCMQRGSNVAVPAWEAIVVLKASRDGGFYVLTTYPECPR